MPKYNTPFAIVKMLNFIEFESVMFRLRCSNQIAECTLISVFIDQNSDKQTKIESRGVSNEQFSFVGNARI